VDQPDDDNSATGRKWLFVIAIGLGLYGGYCLVQSPRVRAGADAVPRMTCDRLIQKGPGTHRHIVLIDANLSGGKSVGERDSDTGALEMYHPLYPAHLAQEPRPAALGLVLCILAETDRRRIRDDRNERQRLGQLGLSELTIEVCKRADAIPLWARNGLPAQYPGIQLANCWVATVGNDEPTAERAARLQWHGIGATSAAAAALVVGWLWRRLVKS
jgi:hypothetical protein